MKIVIALDSFKGSCSSEEACIAVSEGVKKFLPSSETVICPISDGGEGLIDALFPILSSCGYKKLSKEVTGPYKQKVTANYLKNDNNCIIEMAQCSGIELQNYSSLNAMEATTYGLGELLDHVISQGCNNIKIGLGGSATNDAGIGFAQALGVEFFDVNGCKLDYVLCAKDIQKIATVDTSKLDVKLKGIKIYGTCDVSNTLVGENGATFIFGPQKGIEQKSLSILDNNINNLSKILDSHYKKRASEVKGSGAAGGMGAALLWYCNGTLKRGIDVVMDILKIEDQIKDSSLVIVGEGRIDGQSVQGKAPVGVANIASKYGVPVIAICGGITDDANILYNYNIDAMFSICKRPMDLEYSISNAKSLLTGCAENIVRLISKCGKINDPFL